MKKLAGKDTHPLSRKQEKDIARDTARGEIVAFIMVSAVRKAPAAT
jgi:hypothetical protein